MTVNANDTVEQDIVSGVGPYPFTFRIFDDTDLAVVALSTDSPSEVVPLTYLTHYTVSGANNSEGGSITLVSPAHTTYAGYTLDIRSNTPQNQPTSIRNIGRFLPEIHEDAFDHLSRQVQDLHRIVQRTVRFSDNTLSSGEMSPIQSWLSKYLVIGPTGLLEAAELTSSGAITSAILATTLDSLKRTAAEISAGVTPTNYAYPPGNLFRYMTSSQISSIQGAGTADTTTGWAAATLVCTAAGGMQITVPAGNYKTTSTIVLPKYVRIVGEGSRRGAGTPPLGFGVSIQAAFAGPVFSAVEGSLTTYDVLIDGINVSGDKGTYGAGHGILITKANGVTLQSMVVSDFGSDNIRIDGAGSYGLACIDVYSAQAGNANFYIDGQYCEIATCKTDGGVYSVYNGTNGDGLSITRDCHFEGPTTRCLHILGARFIMTGGRLVPTITATGGAYINGAGAGFVGTEMFHQNGGTSYGIESDVGAFDYRYANCKIVGFSTAVIAREGAGVIADNNISGEVTGLELVGGSYVGVVEGNHIGGVTNSILHTSGNGKWKIGANRLVDAAAPQTFKRATITAGYPLSMRDCFDAAPPTVASATSIDLPYDTDTVFISGTTAITGINATGHTGRTVRLIFQGILTFTDGSNLKLNGNFTTSANDVITLICDGTDFFEVSRSAN